MGHDSAPPNGHHVFGQLWWELSVLHFSDCWYEYQSQLVCASRRSIPSTIPTSLHGSSLFRSGLKCSTGSGQLRMGNIDQWPSRIGIECRCQCDVRWCLSYQLNMQAGIECGYAVFVDFVGNIERKTRSKGATVVVFTGICMFVRQGEREYAYVHLNSERSSTASI